MKKMKQIDLSVLSRDIDAVIEFLGRRALMQITDGTNPYQSYVPDDAAARHIREILDNLASAASWLSLPLPGEPMESSSYPGIQEEALAAAIMNEVSALKSRENLLYEEKRKAEGALNEARAFANLDVPFSELEKVSYLTLRVGRLDPLLVEELRKNLSGQAAIISLGEDGRILAASSRKGRIALDSELKKMDFIPSAIPEDNKRILSELLSGLEGKLRETLAELEDIGRQKEKFKGEYGTSLQSLTASFLMAGIAEQLKACTAVTEHVYFLSGWVPDDKVRLLMEELDKLTQGRIAIRTYSPEELGKVKTGKEKVPVDLSQNFLLNEFKGLVFSYGAPLYGSIDPTPFVAVSFTILFGLMFGDFGHGLVLFTFGILMGKHGPAFLSRFRKYSVYFVALGISSMIMGFLNAEFFTNPKILEGPVRAITGFLTGHPVNRIIVIMPLPEKGGSVTKLFYFFGFTLSLGVLLNSIGLIINILNLFSRKKYEDALFSRTGLAGLLFFWYALFIALRFIVAMLRPLQFSFRFRLFDIAGLVVPLLGIFLGHVLWRYISGKRPAITEGPMSFIMEGFVEILETFSFYISSTISYLRVGAFALAHAVLAYIVFLFSEEISTVAAGPLFRLLILVFGNLIIIFLEGLIVAIQAVRLQYYEFFSKFFAETGVQFSPFRFRKERR